MCVLFRKVDLARMGYMTEHHLIMLIGRQCLYKCNNSFHWSAAGARSIEPNSDGRSTMMRTPAVLPGVCALVCLVAAEGTHESHEKVRTI